VRNRAFLICVLAIPALAEPAAAQLPVIDVLTMSTFVEYSGVAVSPDNRFVAYTVQRTTLRREQKTVEKNSEIWVTDLQTNRSSRVCCEGQMSALSPSWSSDSRKLAFYRSKSDFQSRPEVENLFAQQAVLAVWDRETNATRDWMAGRLNVMSIHAAPMWLGDQELLILTKPELAAASQQTGSDKAAAGPNPAAGAKQGDETVHVMQTSALRKTEGQVNTNSEFQSEDKEALHCDVTEVNANTGTARRAAKDIYPLDWSLSPSGKTFIFANQKSVAPDSNFVKLDVVAIDTKRFGARTLVTDSSLYAGSFQGFTWSPDGRVAFPYEETGAAGERVSGLLVIEASTGSVLRVVAPGQLVDDHLGRRGVWSSTGEYIALLRDTQFVVWPGKSMKGLHEVSVPNKQLLYIAATDRGQSVRVSGEDDLFVLKVRDLDSGKLEFWEVSARSGQAKQVAGVEGGCSAYSDVAMLLSDGSLIFCRESAQYSADLFRAEKGLAESTQLTHLNPKLEVGLRGNTEVVSWKDSSGQTLKGALLLPADYVPGRRYPLIVEVYPQEDLVGSINYFGMSDGPLNWQVFATRGYAVFVPTIRTDPDTRMADIAKCVLPGIEQVVGLGVADPDRIGVFGHSDGGYSVLALLVQSGLFKAGVMSAGYGNEIGFYGYEHGRREIEEQWHSRARPWKNRELLIDNSPYFFLDKLEAPLLILHGSIDTIARPQLAKEVYGGLEQLGRQADYVEYEGEDHFPGDFTLPHQVDYYQRVLDWFGTYVGKANGGTKGSASVSPPKSSVQ
jgi:dipeptidyl aminopeptidase/acylaminoacyl peptidase